MAFKIDTKSFTLTTETKEEALMLLLKLLGRDIDSFSLYMGVSVEDVKKAPQWAINYLKDILEIEFVHLGYVTKDLKAFGLFFEYKNVANDVNNALTASALTGSRPVVIKTMDIITEECAIKANYIANAVNILNDFLATKEA
jgi:hypothetical protein